MKKSLQILIVIAFVSVGLSAKAQTWDSLGPGMNYICSFGVYNNELYTGSWYDSLDGNFLNMLKWNGTNFDSVGEVCCGNNVYVQAFEVYNNNLYAAGRISYLGGNPALSISKWNGTTWTQPGTGINGIKTLKTFNGFLYVGTSIYSDHVYKWNGVNWSQVGAADIPGNHDVNTLEVYNNVLYAGGAFITSGGAAANFILKWNGTHWVSLGIGSGIDSALGNQIYVLTSYNGELYAAGNFHSASNITTNNIARWNGTSWNALGIGVNGLVGAMTVYNGALYVGGIFDSAGGMPAHYIAKWDGTNWSALGGGIRDSNNNGWVDALISYNGDLIVGGLFDTAGNIPVRNIAKWHTTPTGINVNYLQNNISISPNPFTTATTLTLQGTYHNPSLFIYNLLGQEVRSIPIGTNKRLTINRERLPSGMYFYKLIEDNKEVLGIGKMIIE